jgi:4-diphosphocytidyl-2-C-methyl-D-erythritol kinase
MQSISLLTPAKVNLCLHVLGKNADHYHQLQSIVAFADIGDQLTLSLKEKSTDSELSFSGQFAPFLENQPIQDNLIIKAKRLWSEFYGIDVSNLHFHLQKNLPIGAGLGGGSSNAAATIRALMQLHDIEPTQDFINSLIKLGADVPACFLGQACWMEGIGEQITPLPFLSNIGEIGIVLINQGGYCCTRTLYQSLSPMDDFRPAMDAQDFTHYKKYEFFDFLKDKTDNSMQRAALNVAPEIAKGLAILDKDPKCHLSRMSGSGATLFGLFDTITDAKHCAETLRALHHQLWIKAGALT